jgi:serine phosphatase RsbU (regulator of sigma subunit)
VKRRIPSFRPLSAPKSSARSDAEQATRSNDGDSRQDEIAACLDSFSKATNWGVELDADHKHRLIDNVVTLTDATLEADPLCEAIPSVPMDRAEVLLRDIEKLIGRIDRTESALRDREAELTSIAAVSNHATPSRELAARLEGILESTTRSVGGVAAALYLLDEDTTELKLRACWGLPKSRFIQTARDLRSSLADLEALTGNAVLLTDIQAAPEWHSPEPYRSALVVPIGTTTMPHGTVWFWSTQPRSYSATEIEVANLAAGRLMGEIEQSILGCEVTTARHLAKQLDAAAEFQSSLLADSQILHEDYDLGGWSHQQALIGGAFHHWSLTPQGKLSIAVGAANANHATGSMVATSALSLLQLFESDSNYPLSHALQTINDQHWQRGHEAWQLHLSALQIQPQTGTALACSTGQMHCLVMGDRGLRYVGSALPRLGSDPDVQIAMGRFMLEAGEMFVAFTSRMLGDRFDLARMLKFLRDWREEPAQDLACSIAEQLPVLDEMTTEASDRALVILKSLRP